MNSTNNFHEDLNNTIDTQPDYLTILELRRDLEVEKLAHQATKAKLACFETCHQKNQERIAQLMRRQKQNPSQKHSDHEMSSEFREFFQKTMENLNSDAENLKIQEKDREIRELQEIIKAMENFEDPRIRNLQNNLEEKNEEIQNLQKILKMSQVENRNLRIQKILEVNEATGKVESSKKEIWEKNRDILELREKVEKGEKLIKDIRRMSLI